MYSQILLLTRAGHSIHANPEFFDSLAGGRKIQAERDLERTHQLYDEHVELLPELALRVHMEDMFDSQVRRAC